MPISNICIKKKVSKTGMSYKTKGSTEDITGIATIHKQLMGVTCKTPEVGRPFQIAILQGTEEHSYTLVCAVFPLHYFKGW